MTLRLAISATLAAALTLPGIATARAKLPVLLNRDGAWVLNYDTDSCSAAGAFGSDAERTIIRLTWFEPGDTFQLLLSAKWLFPHGTSSAVDITFGPGSATQHAESMNGTIGDMPMMIVPSTRLLWTPEPVTGDPPKITTEQEKAVDSLEVRIDGGTRRRLMVRSMLPLMTALRTCTRDLVKTWGFDPATQQALASKPEPLSPPGSWLNDSDYPIAALMRGANGMVRFRLDVDPEGQVSACHVLKNVQSPDFEKITCKQIRKHARFKPALDGSGRTASSYYVNTVRYVMES